MIFQTDVFLKSLLEATLDDIRNNIWLLDYILDDFTTNSLLKNKYGIKQVNSAKEWFLNNQINVFHQYVKDKEKFPAIVIVLGSSQEVQELRTMGDVDTETITLMPNQTGQSIPYIVKPFEPTLFDSDSGTVSAPIGLDLGPVSQGMVLVNPENGNGVPILSVNGQDILIEPGLNLNASQLGVIPQYRFFTSRLGRSFFQETWNIIPTTNDPQTLLWLHSIIIFSLLRYREYMENNGVLEITNLNSTDIFQPDVSHGDGEELYSRQVTIQNKVQQTFIRGLHRTIESVLLRDQNPDAVALDNPQGFTGGIKILSNEATPPLEQDDSNWFTVEDEEDN